MKRFDELTNQALVTRLESDYTRLSEGRQQFIFEKTLEILNEDGAEIRARQREQAALRQALKEREPEQFSQEARPAPEQETLYGKAVGTVADWIRELPRAGARASQAVAPDFEWIESQMRSAGMFGPGQRSMGTTTREREESVAKRVADIEKYQKDLEAKGIKSWQDIQEPEQEVAALKAYQEQRAKAEGPTRPGEKGPDVPTLQRKYELKAYSEFQERTKGKSTEELKKYYEENPQQFASDEQFMSNKMATDVVPMEVATERPEGALPKGVQSGSAQTLKDVGENLPTIAAIGGAAALAPGAAAAIARTALPLARVSPETAAQATRTAVGGAFAAMGAKDVATATDPVKLGLGATMLLPAAGAISRGAQAVAGMPSGPSPIQTAMFGRALAKARKAQEKFVEVAKEQESMAQREVKTGTKEAQDAVWSGRETQGLPKAQPEKFELPAEASARPEWAARDRGEKGRLSNQEYQAMMRQFIDSIWRGNVYTADAMRAAGRRAAVERMTAETELPPAERTMPRAEFKQPEVGEVKAPTVSVATGAETKEPAKTTVRDTGIVGDVVAQQARNVKDITSLLFRGAEKLTQRKPLRPYSPAPGPVKRAMWSAQDFVKDLVQNLKNVEPKAAAVAGVQMGAMVEPIPAASLPKMVGKAEPTKIDIVEPVSIPSQKRPAAAEQPKAPKAEKAEGGMNVKDLDIADFEMPAGTISTKPITWDDLKAKFGTTKEEQPKETKAETTPPPELLPEPSKVPSVSKGEIKPVDVSTISGKLPSFARPSGEAQKISPEMPRETDSEPSPPPELLPEPSKVPSVSKGEIKPIDINTLIGLLPKFARPELSAQKVSPEMPREKDSEVSPPPELLPEPSIREPEVRKPPAGTIDVGKGPQAIGPSIRPSPSSQQIAPEVPREVPSRSEPNLEILPEPSKPSPPPAGREPAKATSITAPSALAPTKRPAAAAQPVVSSETSKVVDTKQVEPEATQEKDKTEDKEKKKEDQGNKDVVNKVAATTAATTAATVFANVLAQTFGGGGKGTGEVSKQRAIQKGTGAAGFQGGGEDYSTDAAAQEEVGKSVEDWNLLLKNIYGKEAATLTK